MRRTLPALLMSSSLLFAQEPATPTTPSSELQSGPVAGVPIPALPVYAPAGPDAGREFDLSRVIGTGPGAVLFVHELTRNVAPLVRGLDQFADTHAVLGLTTGVVLVAADRSEAERRVELSSRSLRLARPMLVAVDGQEGPGAYALNRRATLTLVLCNEGRIVRSIALTDTGQQDLPKLRSWLEEVTGLIPETPGALRELALARLPQDLDTLRARAAHLALELHWRARRSAEAEADRVRREGDSARPMARDAARGQDAAPKPAADRRGAAPTDETLRTLLRAAIQKDADAATLDEVFAKIKARAAESQDLLQQATAMLDLMLSLDYGNDLGKARAKAQFESFTKGR